MSVYSIHFSPTGGTEKVMAGLCAAFDAVTTIDLTRRDVDFSQYHFTAQDVCLIGMPVYGGRFPAVAIERFAAMQGENTPCALVAVYGNRAIDDALIDLGDVAQAHGFVPVAGVEAVAAHSLFPQVAADRPDADDLTQLAEMSAKIKAAALSPVAVEMPGNRPYKVRKPNGVFPQLANDCTHCGHCASVCPVGAIDSADPTKLDQSLCIGCMRCVSQCPTGTRVRPADTLAPVWARLETAFGRHKPNVLYLAD